MAIVMSRQQRAESREAGLDLLFSACLSISRCAFWGVFVHLRVLQRFITRWKAKTLQVADDVLQVAD